MKKIIVLLAMAVVSLSALCAFLPTVGNGTAPNQWTKNVEGVLKAAKTTGYPIFVLIINDSDNGDGCSHCATFISKTINTSEFEALKRSNKFYMVLLNYWSGAQGYTSSVSQYHSRWRTAGTGIYANADVLPDIAVVDPYTGEKAKGWGVPWGDGRNKTSDIKAVLDRYVHLTSKFSIEPVSPSTSVARGGSWQGNVVRSGGSGLAGTASLTLSGKHAAYYSVAPASLDWGTGDGNRAFQVVGPTEVVDPVLMDDITVTVDGKSDGADVVYGNRSVTLTFKDARIKQTLDEFGQAKGLDGLSSSNAVWYVSTNTAPLALETVFNNETRLTLNAAKPGKLTLALSADSLAVLTGNSAEVTYTPSSGEPMVTNLTDAVLTVCVSAGDKVEFTFATATANASVGFAQFGFVPLELALKTPANDASFSWPDLCQDASLVDMSWESNAGAPEYGLYLSTAGAESVFAGEPVAMGATTSTNGVDAGIIRTDIVMGTCHWGVKVTDLSADVGVASTAQTATFSITAKPEYKSASASVNGYLKAGTAFDFGAWAPAGTGPVTYSAKGLPDGLTLDKKTGMISGIPKKAGTYTITVTASNAYGSATKTITLTVAKFPTKYKGNYNGIFFDGKAMPYSITWKVSTGGKWTGKLLQSNGRNKSVKGQVLFDEKGLVSLSSPDLTIRQVNATLWTGTWGGATMYGKMTEKLDSSLAGIWTTAAQSSRETRLGAYAVSKVASSGKASFSGKAYAKQKFSGKGQALVLTGGEINTYVSAWANGGKTGVFTQGCKKTSGQLFCGGFVYWQGGACNGHFTLGNFVYDKTEGSLWSKDQKLGSLNGAHFGASGDFGSVAFGLTATDKKLSPVDNPYSAKISAKVSKGLVSGSFKAGGASYKYEGVLYKAAGGNPTAFGGVSSGSQVGTFSIDR